MKRLLFLAVAIALLGGLLGAFGARLERVSYAAMPWTQPVMRGTTGGGGGAPTGSCSQSTAWFSRVWALPATLDGTVGGSGHVNDYDVLICGLVSDGVWATLDALWVPATNVATGTATAVAVLNLVSSSFTLTQHGTPTFTADRGYAGTDVATAVNYFDTGYTPSTAAGNLTQNSATLTAWRQTSTSVTNGGGSIGVAELSPSNFWLYLTAADSAGQTDFTLNQSSNMHSIPGSLGGSFVSTRVSAGGTASTDFHIYNNGIDYSGGTVGPVASSGVPNISIFLLAENNGGTPANGEPNIISAASIGGKLTSSQVSISGHLSCTGGPPCGFTPRLCTYLLSRGAIGSCP